MGGKCTCWVVLASCFFNCATLQGLCHPMLLYAPLSQPVIRSQTNVGPKHTFCMAATCYSSSIQSHTSHYTLARRRLELRLFTLSLCFAPSSCPFQYMVGLHQHPSQTNSKIQAILLPSNKSLYSTSSHQGPSPKYQNGTIFLPNLVGPNLRKASSLI